MSKQRKNIIIAVLIFLILAIILTAFFVTRKDTAHKTEEKDTVSSDVSSVVNVENIESESTESKTESSKNEVSSFIEPDESEADKILEQNIVSSSKNNTSDDDKTEPTDSKPKEPTTNNGPQSFEDGKNALEKKALDYLKEHNIDVDTAGETGEVCPNCGKKIWNPDKYGPFIPGMPKDYENSGYCLGTCGISFE